MVSRSNHFEFRPALPVPRPGRDREARRFPNGAQSLWRFLIAFQVWARDFVLRIYTYSRCIPFGPTWDACSLVINLKITVQAGKKVNAEIRKQHGSKAHEAHDGQLFATPAPYESKMEHCRVNEPRYQGPRFLRVPTPV